MIKKTYIYLAIGHQGMIHIYQKLPGQFCDNMGAILKLVELNKVNMLFLVGIKGQKGEPGITGDGSNESGKGFKVGSIYVVYLFSQPAFTCSKLTTETLEQGEKYIQS